MTDESKLPSEIPSARADDLSSAVIELSSFRKAGVQAEPPFYRRWFPHLVAVLALLALIVMSCLFWLEVSKRFPRIEAGSYVGNIIGAGLSDKQRPVKFYVERAPGGEDLFFAILKPGWTPQVVSSVVSSAGRLQSQWLLPITVQGPEGKLRFIGTTVGPFRYGGAVTNLDTGREGEWSLRVIHAVPSATDDVDGTEIRLWLLLWAELQDVEAKIAAAEAKVPEQRAEIEKLTNLLTEGVQLKIKSNEKFIQAKEDLQRVKEQLEIKREQAKRLEASIEVSQRVTGMGRLVSLARESLEREWRWADSMLRAGVKDQSEDLKAAIERAERITALKKEIARQREALRQAAYERGVGVRDENPGGEINNGA